MRKHLMRHRGVVVGTPAAVAPAFTSQPALTSTPAVGQAATFDPGAWSGTAPIVASTRFRVDGVDVGAADDLTYTPIEADQGKTLTVAVSLTGPGGVASTVSAGAVIEAAAPVDPPVYGTFGYLGDPAEVNDAETFAGTKYYIDPTTGSDADNGLTEATAWATRTNVQPKLSTSGQYAVFGSPFLFKRGENYSPFNITTVGSLSPGGYAFLAYGSGAYPKFEVTPGLTSTSFWSIRDKLNRYENLELDGNQEVTATNGAINGIFPFASGLVSLQCKNLHVHDFTAVGIELQGDNIRLENVLVERCYTRNGTGAGIGGDAGTGFYGSNITVRDCGTVSWTLNHQIYLHNFNAGTLRNFRVECTGGPGTGTGNFGVVIHGANANGTVKDGLFLYTYNGLGTDSGYGTPTSPNPEFFDSMVYERLWFGHLSQLAATTGQGNCHLVNGHHNSVARLYVGWDFRSRAVNWYEGNPTESVYVNDWWNENNIEEHNAFIGAVGYSSGAGGFGGTYSPASNIKNQTFRNIIWSSRKAAANGTTLFIKPSTIPNSEVHVKNCCFWLYDSASTSDKVISWDGVLYSVAELVAHAAANPGLGIDFTGCIQADPLFVFDATDTLKPIGLQAGSPCINAGTNSGLALDIYGDAYHATTPSIGPFAGAAA